MSRNQVVLHKAKFNPRLKTYIMFITSLVLIVTVIGIFVLPIWLIMGNWYLNRYFECLECELTTRSIRFRKGYWFKTERTIPLDKIQDVTFKEGPILNYLSLSTLKFETAGQSVQGGADLSLTGIVGATEFRNMVLEQRDRVTDGVGNQAVVNDDPDSVISVLKDIRAALGRIEGQLRDRE